MVTLKDISQSLGLSITTVSRALNGFPEVNEETRRLVTEQAEAMGYSPNKFAQKLVTGRSGLVGLVLKAPPDLMIDKLFVEVMTGLSAIFSTMNRDFVLNVTTEADEMTSLRRLVARGTLDGFILTEPRPNDPRVAFLKERGARFVLHGRVTGDQTYPFYDIDNRDVGLASTRHLLSLGHQRIAYLNGNPGACYAIEREAGWRDALTAAGIAPDPAMMRYGSGYGDHGHRTVEDLLDMTDPPTAVICHNTEVAAEVYRVARDRGLSIPHDLSVVAHDDGIPGVDPAQFTPGLTVTSCPIRKSTMILAELLDRCIAGAPLKSLQVVDRAELCERHSTAPFSPAAATAPREAVAAAP